MNHHYQKQTKKEMYDFSLQSSNYVILKDVLLINQTVITIYLYANCQQGIDSKKQNHL